MQLPSYLRIVRASAAYDLLVTLPFALPWGFAAVHAAMAALAAAWSLPGTVPALDPLHMLLANLLGSVVVVWSLARWWAPSVLMGRLDAVARGLFAVWQVYAVAHGASSIVLLFTAAEVAFGVLQLQRIARPAVEKADTP